MSKVRRDPFVNTNLDKSVDLAKLRDDGEAARLLREAGSSVDQVASADLDGDGKISGRAELEKVFDVADHLDTDGNRNSLIDVDFRGRAQPAGKVLSALGLLASNRADGSVGAGPARSIDEQLASMSNADKAAMAVMEYGSSRHVPKSGSMIVNQTHINQRELANLRGVAASYEARHGRPLLIAADQEGGKVNRMGRMPGYSGVRFPSPKEMQSMSLEQIRAEGQKTGRALRDAGVNTLLGPVLDVADPRSLMDKMDRAFGSTPEEVTARAQAFIDGIHDANPNVAIMAKHYPGYNARGNSDIAVVTSHESRAEIARRASPFHEVEGLDGIMLNSIRYDAYGGEPACFSKPIIDELRAHNPDAVVMTDDLYASSLLPTKELRDFKEYVTFKSNPRYADHIAQLRQKYPQFEQTSGKHRLWGEIDAALKDNVKRAFLAGADHFLIMDARKSALIRVALTELVQERPELQQQLDDSARRLLKMRQTVSGQGTPEV